MLKKRLRIHSSWNIGNSLQYIVLFITCTFIRYVTVNTALIVILSWVTDLFLHSSSGDRPFQSLMQLKPGDLFFNAIYWLFICIPWWPNLSTFYWSRSWTFLLSIWRRELNFPLHFERKHFWLISLLYVLALKLIWKFYLLRKVFLCKYFYPNHFSF